MNLIISVAGLVLCMLGLVQALAGRQMEESTRRHFIAFFVILTAYVGSNLLGRMPCGTGSGKVRPERVLCGSGVIARIKNIS